MMMPFYIVDWITIGDMERCPYNQNTPERDGWIQRDDRRLLLIALDRWAVDHAYTRTMGASIYDTWGDSL